MQNRFFGTITSLSSRVRHIKFLLPLMVLVAGTSHAVASSYQVTGEIDETSNFGSGTSESPVFGGAYSQTSSSPFEASGSSHYNLNGGQPNPTVIALSDSSDAEFGSAHLDSTASYSRDLARGASTEFDQYNGSANAILTITDLVITGTNPTVSTKLNLHLAGLLEAGSPGDNGTSNNLGATAQTNVTVFINGNAVDTGTYSQRSNGGVNTGGGSGLLANFTGDNTLTTQAFTVPTNTPITLQLNVGIGTIVSLAGDTFGAVSANANFEDTFSFATDGPVFTLPVGYTADSASAGIIANTFVETPEPTMLSAAVLLSGLLRRRRSAIGS